MTVAAVCHHSKPIGRRLALTDVNAASGLVQFVMFVAFLASATILVVGMALVRSTDKLTTPPTDPMPARAAEDPPERQLVAGKEHECRAGLRMIDGLDWSGALLILWPNWTGWRPLGRDQQVLVDHVIFWITEILQRSEIEIISGDATYDENRHARVGSVSAWQPVL
jgi:hypothetical protein